MRHLVMTTLMTVCATLSALPAQAGGQQERMKQCNADARTQALKGEERRQFMSRCLRGQHDGTAAQGDPARLKACRAEAKAKALKGDERQNFINSCLQG